MNKIEIIATEKLSGEYKWNIGKILIDNIPLIEIIKEIEIPFSKAEGHGTELAGAYDYISIDNLIRNLTSPPLENQNYLTTILGCECGTDECWPLMVKITETNNSIIWNNFKQPYRDNWDYSKFNGFEFNKENYLLEIKKLCS